MSGPSEKELNEHLRKLVNWKQFALYLPGIEPTDIAVIEEDKKYDVVNQKLALYDKWIRVCPSASWQHVIQALEEVKENTIAKEIRSKFESVQAAMSPKQPAEPEEQATEEIEVSEDVVDELHELHRSFVSLTREVKSEIEKAVKIGTITVKKLVQHTEEEKAFKIKELQSVQTTDHFFKAILPHYNFLNCYLIISLATLIQGSIVQKSETYYGKSEMFKKQTKVKYLQNTLKRYFQSRHHCDYTKVEISLENKWGDHNLWLVEVLVKTLFGLKHPEECQWLSIIPGSLVVTFLLHKHITEVFTPYDVKKLQFMRLIGVISLEIGGVCVLTGEEKGSFSFNDSLIQATELGNTEAVSFLIQYLQVNVNVQTQQPFFLPSQENECRIKTDFIMRKVKKLEKKFIPLVEKIKSAISIAVENGSLSIQELLKRKVNLENNEPRFTIGILESVTTTEEFFRTIEPQQNFLNCNIIVNVGWLLSLRQDSTERMVSDYKKKLDGLKQSNQFVHLQEALEQHFQTFDPNSNVKIEIGLENIWQTCTIQHVEELLRYVFSLNHLDEFLWFRVLPESLTVVFLAPKHMLTLLTKCVQRRQHLRLVGVISLQIESISILKEKKDNTFTFEKAIAKAKEIITEIENTESSSDESEEPDLLVFLAQVSKGVHKHQTSTRKDIETDNNGNYYLNYDTGSTPLIIACCNDHTPLVELLICKGGANPNIKTTNGWTALMYASVLGNIKVVCMLVRYGGNVNLSNTHGETALMHACFAGNSEVLKILMLIGSDPLSQRKDGSWLLHIAANENHRHVVEIVLDLLSEPNISERVKRRIDIHTHTYPSYYMYRTARLDQEDLNRLNHHHYLPLHIASGKGNLQIVEKLLEAKAEPNLPYTEHTSSPLHLASKKGHLQIVQRLLRAKANLNVWDRDGFTPLHIASFYGQSEVVKMLLNAKANPNLQMDSGHDLCFFPISKQGKKVTYNDGESNASPTAKIRSQRGSSLYIASFEGHLDIVDTLLEAHADVNTLTDWGYTPLHGASLRGHLHVVNRLLAAGADPDMTDSSGLTPLHIAGSLKIVDRLLEAGADSDIPNNEGETPLYTACERKNLPTIEKLLTFHADPDISTKYGKTPLFIASFHGSMQAVERLLEAGANPDTLTESQCTPLILASSHGHFKVVEILLKQKANINKVGSEITAVYAASMEGESETLELLLQYHADPNVRADDGSTPLYAATFKKYTKTVQILLKSNADPNIAKAEDFDQVTPIYLCYDECLKDTEALLKTINYPTFQPDSTGYTPLHVASMHGDPELIQLLLSYNTDTTAKTPLGHTALMIAELLGHSEVAELLLK